MRKSNGRLEEKVDNKRKRVSPTTSTNLNSPSLLLILVLGRSEIGVKVVNFAH